jgi:hypothetical protein
VTWAFAYLLCYRIEPWRLVDETVAFKFLSVLSSISESCRIVESAPYCLHFRYSAMLIAPSYSSAGTRLYLIQYRPISVCKGLVFPFDGIGVSHWRSACISLTDQPRSAPAREHSFGKTPGQCCSTPVIGTMHMYCMCMLPRKIL